MADIKRLLNKKGWTGRELGQLLLANIVKHTERGTYETTQQITHNR